MNRLYLFLGLLVLGGLILLAIPVFSGGQEHPGTPKVVEKIMAGVSWPEGRHFVLGVPWPHGHFHFTGVGWPRDARFVLGVPQLVEYLHLAGASWPRDARFVLGVAWPIDGRYFV